MLGDTAETVARAAAGTAEAVGWGHLWALLCRKICGKRLETGHLETAFVYFSYQITLFFHAETSGNYDFSIFSPPIHVSISALLVCVFLKLTLLDTSFAWHPIKHRTLEI